MNITFNAGLDTAGTNDATGTLRVHKDNFKMYNVNVKNTRTGIQAGALSEYGNRAGFYGCAFYGYQDTLLASQGTQVYLKGYIEVSVSSFDPMGGWFSGDRARRTSFTVKKGRLTLVETL